MKGNNKHTHLLMVNLHEVDYINTVLESLAKEYVRETLVLDAEGIMSRHGKTLPKIGLLLQQVLGSLKEKNNQNFLVLALVNKDRIANVTKNLKLIAHNDKYASSFWFIPIEGYFYHKGT